MALFNQRKKWENVMKDNGGESSNSLYRLGRGERECQTLLSVLTPAFRARAPVNLLGSPQLRAKTIAKDRIKLSLRDSEYGSEEYFLKYGAY
uniref:SFRICE_037686 n=1 Tax=Spodoptera frugiperda TaxID=7108 RepID=A0A2H1WWX7_SPOFR